MDDTTIKDDEIDLDDIDPIKAPIPLVDDELGDAEVVSGNHDTLSIDDLADAEEEEEEDMYEEDEM
jgi:hypothetical protein